MAHDISDAPPTICVPMLLSTYVNYAEVWDTEFDPLRRGQPRWRVYLSPYENPKFDALQVSSGSLSHDIYDQIRTVPYNSWADPGRVTESRSGMYLHWSLPLVYRHGVTATDSAQDGRSSFQSQSEIPMNDSVTYRQVPTRWIVMRRVDPSSMQNSLKIVVNGKVQDYLENGQKVDRKVSLFIVESDCIRSIEQIDESEDIEVTCSPYVGDNSHSSDQTPTYLGRTMPMETWPGETNDMAQPLTVSCSANPFFADFQPFNASVFSFFDNLSVSGPDGVPTQFVDAYVSYTVIGYHQNQKDDPMFQDGGDSAPENAPKQRLKECFMTVSDQHLSDEDKSWLNLSTGSSAITLCHGNMFNLEWRLFGHNPKLTFPGDQVQTALNSAFPISVGTNPVDALFGWLRSQTSSDLSISDPVINIIKPALRRLFTLLVDVTNDFDTQMQAEDLIATDNFIPTSAGVRWHLSPDNKAPSEEDIEALRALNAQQSLVNSLLRKQKSLQSKLFFQWWTYSADKNNMTAREKSEMKQSVATTASSITAIQIKSRDLMNSITDTQSSMSPVLSGMDARFFIQREPTVFAAGLSSKWPVDFDQDTKVRLPSQIDTEGFPDMADLTKLPEWVCPTAQALLKESRVLQSLQYSPPVPPQYYRNGDRFRDNTDKSIDGKNGWFPLFIEWEAEYYHIPFDQWAFIPRGSESRIGYGLGSNVDASKYGSDPDHLPDYRVLSGRCPILPQASASINQTLNQLLGRLNQSEIPSDLQTEIDALKKKIQSWDFLSTQMSGFTDQLVTRMQGTHVTPINYDGPTPTVDPQFVEQAQEIGMDESTFLLMGEETRFTPFSGLVQIPTDFNPFKPCTHGQFRFTKFNVVDRFGQLACAINPIRDNSDNTWPLPTSSALFPGLGDKYALDQRADGEPNSVLNRNDGSKSNTFVQLPPSINQNARINAGYVGEEASWGPNSWKLLDEWENAIVAWVVINYADTSFQIFSSDGQFVRELCMRPPDSFAQVRPFGLDAKFDDITDLELKLLLQAWSSFPMEALWNTMIATARKKHALPSLASGSMLSSVGKPLAVVRIGASIELADDAYTNLSTATNAAGSTILNGSYNFGVKVGDRYNPEDGFYGYWTGADYWNFFSYEDPQGDAVRSIEYDLKLEPFYPNPWNDSANTALSVSNFEKERNRNLLVLRVLVDPFKPVHLYTDLLPVAQVQIPPLSVDQGLARIASFFLAGPVLIAGDVPPTLISDDDHIVRPGYRLPGAYDDGLPAPLPTGSIQLPAVSLGDWNWLQPYFTSNDKGSDDRGLHGTTDYNVLTVDPVPLKPKWSDGPYVATEGILQMARPFTKPAGAKG